mmetsp:Transcript_10920/g.13640  ORF Transcript_10920/g.13640 Transcript_10920/m.13640 type:complete len:356 (+) Transcript_10920:23-1090(+)
MGFSFEEKKEEENGKSKKLIAEAFEEEEVVIPINPRAVREKEECEEQDMVAAARKAATTKKGSHGKHHAHHHKAHRHHASKGPISSKNKQEKSTIVEQEEALETEVSLASKKSKPPSPKSPGSLSFNSLLSSRSTESKKLEIKSTATLEWELVESLIPVPESGELRKIFVQKLAKLGSTGAILGHDDKNRHLLFRAVEKKDAYAARAILDAAYHNEINHQHFLEWIDLRDFCGCTAYELANRKNLQNIVQIIDAVRKQALNDIGYNPSTSSDHVRPRRSSWKKKLLGMSSKNITTNSTAEDDCDDVHIKPTATHLIRESIAGQTFSAFMQNTNANDSGSKKNHLRRTSLNSRLDP